MTQPNILASVRAQLTQCVMSALRERETLGCADCQEAISLTGKCPVTLQRVLIKCIGWEISMRETHPVIFRKLVDRNQRVLPLRHARQHCVPSPEIRIASLIFTGACWMVDENRGPMSQSRLPNMFAP